MSRRFTPPDTAFWETSWAQSDVGADRRSYLAACRVFDPVLGPLLATARPGATALELGCYPGGFMAWLSTLGYEVSGLDAVEAVADLGETLTAEGTRCGRVWRADLFRETPQPTFDVVASFGLVEHFEDGREVIDVHRRWARPGGLVVTTMPHFRNLQWAGHRLLDRRSLRTHNTRLMRPSALREALVACGLEPLHVGLFGTSEFWVEPDDTRGAVAQAAAHATVRVAGGLARRVRDHRGPAGLPNHLASPFVLAVSRVPG